jgi:alanine racemase
MNPLDRFTSCAIIDLDAIAHNVRTLADQLGPGVELYAVVKANAYGHGAVQVARTALESGATRLAVAHLAEGIELRRAGIEASILVMGYVLPAEAGAMVKHDLTATVNTIEVAQVLSNWAGTLGRTATVHVEVDTGMGRYGLLPEEVLPFVEQIGALPGLDLEGMFTHFATADWADRTFTREQFGRFSKVVEAVREAGYTPRVLHAANSAATLDLPEMHLDAVRTGIAMYGLRPSDEIPLAVPLRPALELKSHVARVRTLPPGSGISYGHTFITSDPTPVALVPIGYGCGYRRILSNRGSVLIRGQRAPIVGRVCMDQFMVDVSGIKGVEQDDEVVLLGTQENAHISAEEIASLAGTINYEITTGLMPRVPRVYVRGGEVVEVVELNSAR